MSMHGSGTAQCSHLERPWKSTEHQQKEQPEASGSTEERVDCCCCNFDEHQAAMLTAEKGSRHWVKAWNGQVQQLRATPDVKTEDRDSLTQDGHVQLLADIDSFITLLQTPPRTEESTLQPVHTATVCGTLHAEGVEDATSWQNKLSAVRMDSSGTREGTTVSTTDSGSCENARVHTLQSSRMTSDDDRHVQSASQQPDEAAAGKSCSNHTLSLAEAAGGEAHTEHEDGGHARVRQDIHDGSKGVSSGSRSGGYKHLSKAFVEIDQAVHKLHDLEDVAQASLDELESLLREQQAKVSTLCICNDSAHHLPV